MTLTTAPVKFPAPLEKGDTIAICSPAGPVDPAKVAGAVAVLEQQGWRTKVMPHALGSHGNFSGTADERYADMAAALTDPEVRAVLCSRGGYGVVHIMDRLARLPLADDPKWVIGFSDISAMHALMASKGVASIHSPMAAQIMKGTSDADTASLFGILRGERPAYVFPSHEFDRRGIASGRLFGGNLAVLAELISTPYDIIVPDSILFLEDVAEPIYKIERIFYQLRLSGVLGRLRGLIVGQFTEYRRDRNYTDMESMIRDATAGCNYPIAFGVPIGHVDHNLPVIESAEVTLKVSPSGTNSLIFHRS